MSDFTFAIHHIFAQEIYTDYDGRLDALFGGPENNPFHKDAVSNKIALASSSKLALAVQRLSDLGNTTLSDVGLGGNAHLGGHVNYSTFQTDALEEIFDPAGNLSPEQQRAAIYDLHKFSSDLSKSGHPPIHGTSVDDFKESWKSQLPDGTVGSAINKSANTSGLQDMQSTWNDADPDARVSDATVDNNPEARTKFAVDLLRNSY